MDGSHNIINRCGSKKYKFQLAFYPSDKIVNITRKRVLVSILPLGTLALNCHSADVIYLITCSNCYLQCVDKVALKLNQRFNPQKTAFCHPKNHSHFE